jgi:anaerobic selenocysteine-containing dehydrogenase
MLKPLSRRQFLAASATVVSTAAVIGGIESALAQSRPGLAGQLAISGNEKIVPSICSLCPSGCGVLVRVSDGHVVKLEGNPMHPINTGSLCPKGQATPELLYNPDRLTGPMRRIGERGSGQWETVGWDEAIQTIAGRLNDLRSKGHPEQAAFMYGETRGQVRPLIERFMQAIGSPNAISHDSLNTEAARLAMYLTQGIYGLPAYDLENSHYVLSFGASLLEAGPTPQRMISGYSFLRQGRADRGKVVVIDPRQGITGAKADEWIPIKPGTDAALALSIAYVIITTGQFDSDFVHNYSFGFEDFTDPDGQSHIGFKSFVLENYAPAQVEKIVGIPATIISRLAGEFASNSPAVAILPGKGGLLNGSINGLYAGMAVHMLNALVGSIEKRGGVLVQRYMPFKDWPSLPSDRIAENGRQAERADGAGTAFPLARHAYQAVADRVLAGYPVDTLMLYDANPVYEVPGGARFIEAFNKIPLVVSIGSFMDDTAQYADLILPEPTFLERYQDDHIEGVGYPGIGLRQPVIEPLHDTRNVGDLLLNLASTIGGPVAAALAWPNFEALLRDRLKNIGTDWDMLSELGVWLTPGYRFSRRGSETWINEVIGPQRRSAPRDGRFDFFSRELRCLLGERSREELSGLGISASGDAVFIPHYEEVSYAGQEDTYPFLLNVITLMSLGPYSAAANMPTLQEISGMTVGQTWNSWVEMNPEAAAHLHLQDGDEVWVQSPFGTLRTELRLVAGLRPDVVNLPHNQGHKAIGRWAKDRGVNGLEIMNPASEPVTGLAAFTNTRVRLLKV